MSGLTTLADTTIHDFDLERFLTDRYGGAYREELRGFAESLLTATPPVAISEIVR